MEGASGTKQVYEPDEQGGQVVLPFLDPMGIPISAIMAVPDSTIITSLSMGGKLGKLV